MRDRDRYDDSSAAVYQQQNSHLQSHLRHEAPRTDEVRKLERLAEDGFATVFLLDNIPPNKLGLGCRHIVLAQSFVGKTPRGPASLQNPGAQCRVPQQTGAGCQHAERSPRQPQELRQFTNKRQRQRLVVVVVVVSAKDDMETLATKKKTVATLPQIAARSPPTNGVHLSSLFVVCYMQSRRDAGSSRSSAAQPSCMHLSLSILFHQQLQCAHRRRSGVVGAITSGIHWEFIEKLSCLQKHRMSLTSLTVSLSLIHI